LILIVPGETSVAVEDALRTFGEQPIRMGRVVRK
jgi:hypothetical protein